MGAASSGAGNVNSFKEGITVGQIPMVSSLPYQGVINENMFAISSKEDEKIIGVELGYTIAHNPISNQKEIYLSTLLKSKYDGIGARISPIDIVISLDISGSMSFYMEGAKESCLSLAKTAIFKLAEKLTPEDKLGLVTFNTTARDVFPMKTIAETPDYKDRVSSIKANGGTSLYSGLEAAVNMMKADMEKNHQRRIIYITDMNSFNEDKFIELYYSITQGEFPIFTTIIGIGIALNTALAEVVMKNKGSSFFSATKEEHLNKFIVDEFEYNFFPVAFDVDLEFHSGNYQIKRCIGSSFKEVTEKKLHGEWKTGEHYMNDELFKRNVEFMLLYFHRLNKKLPKAILANYCNYMRYTKKFVSNINSVSSAPIEQKNANGEPLMQGGLILLRLIPEQTTVTSTSGGIILHYTDSFGNKFNESHPFTIDLNSPLDKYGNFFSSSGIRTGMALYYYTKFSRIVMKICNGEQNKNKEKYHIDYLNKDNLEPIKARVCDFVSKYMEEDLAKNYNGKTEKLCEIIWERISKGSKIGVYRHRMGDDN